MEQEHKNYEEFGESEASPSGTNWLLPALFAVAGILLLAIIALVIFAKKTGGGQNVNPPVTPAPPAVEKTQSAGNAAVQKDEKDYNYAAPGQDDCQGLSSDEETRLCLDNIVAAQAVQNNNLSGCYGIKTESLRFDCVLKIARDTGDAGLCSDINDNFTRYRCVAMIASEKKDPKLCDKLQSGDDRQNCQDQVAAFSIAQDGDKDSLYKCRKLKSQEYIDLCFLHSFINKFNGDCAAVPQNYRQECLDVLAKE